MAQIARSLPLLVVGLILGGHVGVSRADKSVLDLYVGTWNVRVKTLQPVVKEVTYVESYRWALGGNFIQGETTQKSDGTSDVMFGTFEQGKGYHFWIFSSSGSFVYLPPATWDAAGRVMNWKNPPGWDVAYTGHCLFPDRTRRTCSLQVRDWKGKILLEQQTTAVRQGN